MKLLTTDEVAEMLQMHKESIRRLCRDGEIPCIKVGRHWRIKEDDLHKWINEQK